MIWLPVTIVAFLIIAFLVILYFFKMAFVRGKSTNILEQMPKTKEFEGYLNEIREGVAWFERMPKNDVYIQSHDGLKLHAYIIKYDGANKTILLFHGYRSSAQRDFSCAMEYYYSLGMNIILVDQRAHGASEGRIIAYGVKERFDAKAWVEYAKAEFPGTKIFLSGISMGSSTIMMASDILDGVSGIVADCGFTSPKEVIELVAKTQYRLPRWFCAPVGFFARIFGGFDYSYSSENSLSKTRIPILFIHGSADNFVPCYMTEKNYNICVSKKKKVIVEGAPHGFSFLVDKQTVKTALENFILNDGE